MAINHAQIKEKVQQVSKSNPWLHRNMKDLPHYDQFAQQGRIIDEKLKTQKEDLATVKKGLREGGDQLCKVQNQIEIASKFIMSLSSG